ncbi:MAG: nucleotidyltransferase domain-containing protein [Thermodesulfobacteriota bacterium]
MMSNKLMQEYLAIYTEFGTRPFTLKDASGLLGTSSIMLRKDAYKLRENFALRGIKRGTYQATEPEKWIGIAMALLRLPELGPLIQSILPGLQNIESMLLYGSRIRGDFRKDSDYDLLIITDGTDLFTEEEVDLLKKHNFNLRVDYEADLKKDVSERPLSIVPILREGWPLFNAKLRDRLLSFYKKENLLKDLRRLSESIIKNKYHALDGLKPSARPSSLFLSYSFSRQLYLMEVLMEEVGFNTWDWLERASEIWKLERATVNRLHRVYRDVEKEKKVDGRVLKNSVLGKMAIGNDRYLNMLMEKWAGYNGQ